MFKTIFYKEWIKTRWYFLLSLLLTQGFTLFQILKIYRSMALKGGASHFWGTIILKDATFIDNLQYIPLLIGILFAIVQFVPEMNHKCLKLSLHLPYSQLKMTLSMLLSGFCMLLVCYLLDILILYLFFNSYFASELVQHVLLTTLPWFMAGLAGYLLFSWICLEPTWKFRVFNLMITSLLLKIYFMPSVPESYNPFFIVLFLGTLLLFTLPWLSVVRFKEGKQD